jgi:hypothetical protein
MSKKTVLNISMRHALIDFENYGYRGYLPVAVVEMQMLLEGAERLIARYSSAAVTEMMDEQHVDLFLQAFGSERVTPQWVSNATLLIAMQGLTGKTLPDIVFTD